MSSLASFIHSLGQGLSIWQGCRMSIANSIAQVTQYLQTGRLIKDSHCEQLGYSAVLNQFLEGDVVLFPFFF